MADKRIDREGVGSGRTVQEKRNYHRTTPTPRPTSKASEMGEVATVTPIVTSPMITPTSRPTLIATPTTPKTAMPTKTLTATLRPPSTATMAPVIATPTPALPGRSNPSAFQCTGGCATPPAGCLIKGNVNSKGEKIYHTPSSRDYKRTDIKLEEGDRWFCTEAEAQDAGFRAPQR